MNNTNKASNTKLHKRKADHKQKRHKQSPSLGKTAKAKHKQKPKRHKQTPGLGKAAEVNQKQNKTQKTQADPRPGEIPIKTKITTTANPEYKIYTKTMIT